MEVLVVLVIIGVLVAVAVPNFLKIREKAKEAEVKSALHTIQLAVERFATDNDTQYPVYLIGGDALVATTVFDRERRQGTDNVGGLSDFIELPSRFTLSDPLLRRGYIQSYPRNPFVRNGIAVHELQVASGDVLRNGSEGQKSQLGTRFGGSCAIMGNVLADFRFTEFRQVIPGHAPVVTRSYSDVPGYPFYDAWASKTTPGAYLPGEFFYKSNGPIVFEGVSSNADGPAVKPTAIEQYMLGAYGSLHSRGMDVLGDEKPIVIAKPKQTASLGSSIIAAAEESWNGGPEAPPPPPPPPTIDGNDEGGQAGVGPTDAGNLVWPWTRSYLAAPYHGSPYSPAPAGFELAQTEFGNPNGIRDGIILVLTSTENRTQQ
jgi:type II secretory pathway pseudopilin PulG